MSDQKYLAGGDDWYYPHAGDPEPPANTKIFILTCGGVATVGIWREEMKDLGWRPLFKRNPHKEMMA